MSVEKYMYVWKWGHCRGFHGQETSLQGNLIAAAEWGEQRIIRLEESGARTPLIVQVPDVCYSDTSTVRLHQPNSMIMTPFGDLIVVDHAADCTISVVWRLQKAMQVPALQSAWDSRLAHKWTQVQHNHTLDKVLQANGVGGIALDGTWEGLYAVVLGNGGKVRLLLVPLLVDEDDEPTTNKDIKTIMDYLSIQPSLDHSSWTRVRIFTLDWMMAF